MSTAQQTSAEGHIPDPVSPASEDSGEHFIFGSPLRNNTNPLLLRQNVFHMLRRVQWRTIFHWVFITLHVLLIVASITALSLSWNDKSTSVTRASCVFIAFMSLTSVAKIFQVQYERRYPLVIMTEFGTIVTRPATTLAGKAALAFDQYLNRISLMACLLVLINLDKERTELLLRASKPLYHVTMAWIFFYASLLLLPILAILVLIACFPFVLLVMRWFYNIPLATQDSRAGPANAQTLERVWMTRFQDDESHEYVNPSNPSQHTRILKEDTKCSICLSLYEPDRELRILPCMHHFHQQCVDEWFRITATCPLCVRPIVNSPADGQTAAPPPVPAPSQNADSNV